VALHNSDGHRAEQATADYLRLNGFKIIATNWKTKWCEVDVIAKKDDCIYFVEVKYRKTDQQGSGFDYIHTKKQQKMARAADSWVLIHKWSGEYVLSAAEVSGMDYRVVFIDQI
jgi:uncharacterized protein (TIGR00252 family)